MVDTLQGARLADNPFVFLPDVQDAGKDGACADQDRVFFAERLQIDQGRIARGDLETAIASLFQIIERTRLPSAYLLLAQAYMKAHETDAAFTVLNILDYIEPDLAEKDLLRGLFLRHLSRNGEAREHLRLAVRRKPKLGLAWAALVDLEMEEHNPAEARRLFEEGRRQAPDSDHLSRAGERLADSGVTVEPPAAGQIKL